MVVRALTADNASMRKYLGTSGDWIPVTPVRSSKTCIPAACGQFTGSFFMIQYASIEHESII